MNDYPVVMDLWTVIPSALASGIHTAAAVAQLALAALLIAAGLLALAAPHRELALLRRWGAAPAPGAAARLAGGLRIGLGALLLLPLAAGAPSVLGWAGSAGTIALLVRSRHELPEALRGRRPWVHRSLVATAAFLLAFGVFELDDPLALGVELAREASAWRNHELAWQLDNDARAPKVGELAPDFELQDPSGEAVVRLSDFRGERPVALIFGSYT